MSLDTLDDVLKHELSDLLSAEKQFAKALQLVIKNADSDTVRRMAEQHLTETQQHAENLMSAFEAIGEKPERMVCEAAKGICDEGKSTLSEEKPKGAIKDVMLVGSSMRVEHYEISGYTGAIGVAKALGKRDVVQILQTNLKDELATAKKLEAASPVLLQAAAAQKPPEKSSGGGRKPAAKASANGASSNASASRSSGRKPAGRKAAASK